MLEDLLVVSMPLEQEQDGHLVLAGHMGKRRTNHGVEADIRVGWVQLE